MNRPAIIGEEISTPFRQDASTFRAFRAREDYSEGKGVTRIVEESGWIRMEGGSGGGRGVVVRRKIVVILCTLHCGRYNLETRSKLSGNSKKRPRGSPDLEHGVQDGGGIRVPTELQNLLPFHS